MILFQIFIIFLKQWPRTKISNMLFLAKITMISSIQKLNVKNWPKCCHRLRTSIPQTKKNIFQKSKGSKGNWSLIRVPFDHMLTDRSNRLMNSSKFWMIIDQINLNHLSIWRAWQKLSQSVKRSIKPLTFHWKL